MVGVAAAGMQARVLIVARDDSVIGPLAEGLDRLGWRTLTARSITGALAALGDMHVEAAIVDLTGLTEPNPTLAAQLKAAAAPRRIPIMAMGHPDPFLRDLGFDLTMAPPVHPAQAAMRLESLVRTAIAEEEYEIRYETFVERGHALEAPEMEDAAYRVLAIG